MKKEQIITYLVFILMFFTSFSNFFLITNVSADDDGGDGSIPAPVLEGYVLDGYAVSNINVSVNKSHFHFENEYINETLEHIDFFVPEELQDDFSYITPCNPDLMVCQIGNAPDPIYGYWDLFHILNDWTNEHSDRFYIETDYIFTYAMYDPDSDIPENFNWVRINQEMRVNYSQNNTGLGELLNSIVEIDAHRDIRINVSSDYNNLVLNYTYFYDDEIVGMFEDNYLSYIPPITDEITLQGTGNNSLNATISKNESVVKLVSNNGVANMTVSLDKGLPTGWAIENTTFTQNFSDSSVSYYPVEIDNESGLEFLLELREQPVSNVVTFNIDAPGLEFEYLGNSTYDVVKRFIAPENSFGVGSFNTTHFHIHRPKIVDAENNWVWGNLTIEDGVMNLSIPQSFLDSAVYPTQVDPTFGNTDYNSYSKTNLQDDYIKGENGQSPANDGTANSISLYCDQYGSKTGDMRFALYEGTELVVQTSEVAITTTEGWHTASFTSPYNIYASYQYKICFWFAPNNMYVWTKPLSDVSSTKAQSYGSNYPSHISWDSTNEGTSYAIYCTYTAANNAPTIANSYPVNNSVDQSLLPQCVVWVNDTDNDDLDCTWQENSTGSWVTRATNKSQSANTKINYTFVNFNTESTKYWYKVFANDGTDNESSIFCFTTEANNTAPTITGEAPVNQSTGISVSPTVYAIVSDADSDTMTCNFYTSSNGADWTWRQTNNTVSTGTNISYIYSSATSYSTKYYWKVTADDGTDNTTSDIYDFTTEVEFLWIDITNSSWNLGNIVMGTSTYTNETGVTFIADMDNTTVNTDLKLQITNDGAQWSAATAGNGADVNTYRLNTSIDIWVADDNQIVTASITTISTDITAGQNETFDLRFDAPSSSTSGNEQTITTTATLVKH